MTTEEKPRKKSTFSNLHDLIKKSMTSVIYGDDGISAFVNYANKKSKLAVVFGENASGKSLCLKALKAFLKSGSENKVKVIDITMQRRTASNMANVFMYLDEEYNSTGMSSLHVVVGTFHNAKISKDPCWIILDEPDVGLSDRYSSAMGAYLAKEINELPEHVIGVIVVSHSKKLLGRLKSNVNEAPHEIAMAEDVTLDQYLDPANYKEASIADLLEFQDSAMESRKGMFKIMK